MNTNNLRAYCVEHSYKLERSVFELDVAVLLREHILHITQNPTSIIKGIVCLPIPQRAKAEQTATALGEINREGGGQSNIASTTLIHTADNPGSRDQLIDKQDTLTNATIKKAVRTSQLQRQHFTFYDNLPPSFARLPSMYESNISNRSTALCDLRSSREEDPLRGVIKRKKRSPKFGPSPVHELLLFRYWNPDEMDPTFHSATAQSPSLLPGNLFVTMFYNKIKEIKKIKIAPPAIAQAATSSPSVLHGSDQIKIGCKEGRSTVKRINENEDKYSTPLEYASPCWSTVRDTLRERLGHSGDRKRELASPDTDCEQSRQNFKTSQRSCLLLLYNLRSWDVSAVSPIFQRSKDCFLIPRRTGRTTKKTMWAYSRYERMGKDGLKLETLLFGHETFMRKNEYFVTTQQIYAIVSPWAEVDDHLDKDSDIIKDTKMLTPQKVKGDPIYFYEHQWCFNLYNLEVYKHFDSPVVTWFSNTLLIMCTMLFKISDQWVSFSH
ncbi:hypothetical protein C0J52_00263 [Blattella germanica]|nr:hypothetical protein C0J52_00263 [Blattella germanica]